MGTDAEGELLSRAREGDKDALGQLLRIHGHSVRQQVAASIEKHWRPRIDLDDLMQISYMEAFLSIRRFTSESDGAFHVWLLRIARNNLFDAMREFQHTQIHNRRRPATPAGDGSYVLLMETLSSSDSPSRTAARHEQIAMMKSALATLPETYRRVIELFDLEAHPAGEVAGVIGRSEGAVYMIRARAHDRLRSLLSAAAPTV